MKHAIAPKRYLPGLLFAIFALCGLATYAVHAADIYRWTDAKGQVHFGDRIASPASGRKLNIKTSPAAAPAVPASVPRMAASMPQIKDEKSTPVDPSLVAAGCKELIDQIALVKPGEKWETLYNKFDATCPGIKYECTKYQSRPENDKCQWVKRTDGNVLSTKNYP